MNKTEPAWLHAAQKKVLPLVKRYRAVLAVLLAGVLLLASGGHDRSETPAVNVETAGTQTFDLNDFRQELETQLAAVDGAGRVSLMLSLDQSEEAVYAVNTRQTTGNDSGSMERDISIVSNGSYGETPVTVKNRLPVFRGAVVLCDGADNASVQLAVTQAVSTVCGIGADKVTVLKMAAGT